MIQPIREKLLCRNLTIQTFALQLPMQAIIFLSASSLTSDNIGGVT
jgi:hypothetical protein